MFFKNTLFTITIAATLTGSLASAEPSQSELRKLKRQITKIERKLSHALKQNETYAKIILKNDFVSTANELNRRLDLQQEQLAGIETKIADINSLLADLSCLNPTLISIAGNLDASADALNGGVNAIPEVSNAGAMPWSTTTFSDLAAAAQFSFSLPVSDPLSNTHTITLFFYRTAIGQYTMRAYAMSEDVDSGSSPIAGLPRQLNLTPTSPPTTGQANLEFDSSGLRSNLPSGGVDVTFVIPWNNGSGVSAINMSFTRFTQFSAASNILAVG